ncbi:chaperonin-like RBCX protein 1, chloroplastic isoform X2 [Rutidosis leptorrhynchoides]|uniref:chaperonin-like RBCX protein 1, chloroplastic isoform X2 n=1 Tax=Rutidosis leptorrhynchoides TaxID=125765 RepID=UPI003A99FE33
MESSTIPSLSYFSNLYYKPHGTTTSAFPCKQWKLNQRTPHKTLTNCQKMYVPGFGEASPEAKAAKNLHNFFTYVAVRIVNAQLESYNTEAHKELTEFLKTHSLNDGDKFCAALMRQSSSLAMRILEMADESNTRLMRDYVLETSHVESEK